MIEREFADLLRTTAPDPLPAGFAGRVEAAAGRLRRRRRLLASAPALVLAAAAAVGALAPGPGDVDRPDRLRPAAPPRVQPSPSLVMPDLHGMDSQQVEDALQPRFPASEPLRYLASDQVPVGQLLTQSPSPGAVVGPDTPIVLSFSAGGPAVPLSAVPEPARGLLAGSLPGDEQVLVLTTPAGNGDKTDQVLTGPCSVTERLYRDLPFPDPTYDSPCYR